MSPSFRIEDVPGKGTGAVASKKIPAGTLLVSETPFVVVPRYATLTLIAECVMSQLHGKPSNEQRKFFNLENNFKNMRPIEGIVKTNAMPLGCGSDLGGIFLESSRFNHSCSANASYSWNADVKEERVYAIREIAAGQEITVCYLADEDWTLSRKKRMVEIQDIHGFECSCARCGEGDVAKQSASDARRQRFVEIERFLEGDWLRVHTPGIALKLCREALGILREEEAAVAMIESIYVEAFRICVSHADFARASVFASLAADERRKWKGHDSAGLQEYKAWELKPQSHTSANQTTQWGAQGKAELPPPSPYTEQWLWQRVD